MKKILCLILAFLVTCSVVVFAEENSKYEEFCIVANGNFEKKTEAWNVRNGEFESSKDEVAEGIRSLRIFGGSNPYAYQTIYLMGNEEYTLTFQTKATPGTTAGIKLEFENETTIIGQEEYDFIAKTDNWEKHKLVFFTPDDTIKALLLIRLFEGMEIYYDDIYIEGPLSPENEQAKKEFEENKSAYIELPPVEGAENVIVNGSYEETDNAGIPSDCLTFGGSWGPFATVVGDAYDGKNCIKISATEPKYPWIRHEVHDLVPGAKYQLTFWYKSNNDECAAKFEFYGQMNTANPFYNQRETDRLSPADEWTKAIYSVTVPSQTDYVQIYLRNYGLGDVWVDNASFVMVELPVEFDTDAFKTNYVFYYPHHKDGTAQVKLNNLYKSKDYSAEFSVVDNGTVLQRSEKIAFSNENSANWQYNVDSLAMDKRYTVVCKVTKTDGTEIELKQNIYRINRPSLIDEKGVCYDEKGNPFDPQILYHPVYDELQIALDAGINVIQGNIDRLKIEPVEFLDEMHAMGVKVALPLYFGMKPAGHPDNIEDTKRIVKAVKDHPAVFGYLIQDEPFAQGIENMAELLEASYWEIRSIDKKHPVMLCECFGNFYAESAKYVDLLIIDPYPGNLNDYLTHVGNQGSKAVNAIDGEKPLLNLLQTFTFNYVGPDVGEIRHMAYQSYLTGQQYLGFYPWEKEGAVDTVNLHLSKWWDEIVSFNKDERPILQKHFTFKQEPTFNKYSDGTISYETWVSGTDVYLALINHTHNEHKIQVPLISQNGKIKLSGVKVTQIAGDSILSIVKDGCVELSLKGSDCILLKLTGSESIDVSLLSAPAFDDLSGYDWAADAIMEIFEKGIANTRGEGIYAPGEAITRGEFAMFLVRTLGLTADVNDNFADVATEAEYAKELAIGKATGILNGVGDNLFNPDATITRQDMMTIISRGMKLYGEADMSAFSDSASIADYALSHVSAMIYTGLVKGNADGTINPLGNTTRAEAAVIMQRIINFIK